MEGIRTSKTVGGVTHNYVTQNGKVVQESYGNTVMQFVYDTNGNPFALRYTPDGGTTWSTYYYMLNAQGDVVAVTSGGLSVVASYTYDAWGRLVTSSGWMASINPLRYRGYYYDTETGFYYVQSRYYDPIVKRFINADSFASTGQGFLGYNMFAYCGNNPISRRDNGGLFWDAVIDVGFIGIDIYKLTTNDGWKNWKNWAALGADLFFTVVPFATGGGQIVKASNNINNYSKVTVVGETMSRVNEVAESVNAVDNLYNGLKSYEKLSRNGLAGKVLADVCGKLQNATWLYGKLRTGYTIIDIGIDASRTTRSSSYIMEAVIMTMWKARNIIKGAIKYLQVKK